MSASETASDRRERLAASIARRGFARVVDLAREADVSEVTVRSDLAALEADGRIARVHGGAIPRGPVTERELSVERTRTRLSRAKEAIAREAAARVRPGQSVLLDVGSTTLAVAHALVARRELDDVVIVTNGLAIALALEPALPRFTVVVTGGTLRSLQHSLVNPLATTLLDGVHADLAIIGATGVHAEHGVTNVNLPEAEVKQKMVTAADRVLLVADASKLGVAHLGRVATLADVNELITDARGGGASGTVASSATAVDDAPRASLAALEAAGLAVTAVPVGAGLV